MTPVTRDRGPQLPVTDWTDTTWQAAAACHDTDPRVFYQPDRGTSDTAERVRIRHAKIVCRGCPVIEQCLEWALDQKDPWAVLGGTTPQERTRIRRKRRSVAS